jgi:hypothetical protein
VFSGETASGEFDLLAAHDGVKKLSPSAYVDGATKYEGIALTNLFDIVPDALPGDLGEMEYISLETNAVLPKSVQKLTDDDPTTGVFSDITSNRAEAPRRTNGVNLRENWFYSRSPAARRTAIKLQWATATTRFVLNSIDIAFKEAP